MVTEMAKGKILDEAIKITRDDVAGELGGLPPQKLHCSNLGADALRAAIKDYWVKIGKISPQEAAVEEEVQEGDHCDTDEG
jgi:nitrogen fixation NifU-like protein